MNHRLMAITAAAVIAVAAIAGGVIGGMSGQDEGDRPAVRAISAVDFTDDRKLAGFANDVFFVYVLAEPAPVTSDAYHWPTVTYSAEVLETLKGSTSGMVRVNQIGAEGATVEGQGDMLETGKSYLLATRSDPNNGWHVVSSAYQQVPVNAPASTDKSDVMDTSEAQAIKERFQEAIRTQEVPSK